MIREEKEEAEEEQYIKRKVLWINRNHIVMKINNIEEVRDSLQNMFKNNNLINNNKN